MKAVKFLAGAGTAPTTGKTLAEIIQGAAAGAGVALWVKWALVTCDQDDTSETHLYIGATKFKRMGAGAEFELPGKLSQNDRAEQFDLNTITAKGGTLTTNVAVLYSVNV